jgi:hypothetical protein
MCTGKRGGGGGGIESESASVSGGGRGGAPYHILVSVQPHALGTVLCGDGPLVARSWHPKLLGGRAGIAHVHHQAGAGGRHAHAPRIA